MKYLYASGQCSNEDYSSGRVLYNMPGSAPFPVKLGCEVFERCRAALAKNGVNGPYTIYDPFCGGGYSLTVLGFIYGDHVRRIIASDIDSRMVSLASRNLSLLSVDGLNQRIKQIEQFINEYKKESHRNALESALRLKSLLEIRCKNISKNIEVDCFCANAIELGGSINKLTAIDMVITDLPYGKITNWSEIDSGNNQVSMFLESLHDLIPSHSIVAIVSDKKQKVKHSLYGKIDSFNAGKRQVTILKAV
jgi:23S rRNA G2445 N2-methylase RlmL